MKKFMYFILPYALPSYNLLSWQFLDSFYTIYSFYILEMGIFQKLKLFKENNKGEQQRKNYKNYKITIYIWYFGNSNSICCRDSNARKSRAKKIKDKNKKNIFLKKKTFNFIRKIVFFFTLIQ